MPRDPSERRFVSEAGHSSPREARRYLFGVLVTALERDLALRDGLILGGLGQHDERLARKAAAKLIAEFKRKAER